MRTSKVHFSINSVDGTPGHTETPVRERLLRSGAWFVRVRV
ncbi:hypothetical protein ACFYQ5_25895 [Streptomyces sp. NPDC005794]